MNYRFKEARESRKMSVSELASLMDVHESTIRNWEAGRREVPIKMLPILADTLGFSMEYLLGRDGMQVSLSEQVDKAQLQSLHGQPVWIAKLGWGLVNIVDGVLVFHNGATIPTSEIQEPVYAFPPALAFSLHGIGMPIKLDEIVKHERIWLEPITSDSVLGNELRGWYHLHGDRMVQNEYGTRFYLDTYGVKWLAFEDCLEKS